MDVIIPDDLFPYFEICGTRKNYAPGEMIRPEAQNNERLYLVESGRVRVYCSNASGRELTLRIMGKGRLIGEDVFVEFTGAKTAVSAVNEVTVVSCSVEELFPYIVESEALLRAILRHLTGTNISLTRHLKRIAIYDSRQKVASYLYEETREDSPSRKYSGSCSSLFSRSALRLSGAEPGDRQPDTRRISGKGIYFHSIPKDSGLRLRGAAQRI